MIQGGPGETLSRSITVLFTMRESRMPRKVMPCQWSVMMTLFSTTQFTNHPSKQPIACMELRSGLAGSRWLMKMFPRRVTPRTSPVPTPPGPTDQLWKPSSWFASGGSWMRLFWTRLYSNRPSSPRPRSPSAEKPSTRLFWMRADAPPTLIPKRTLRTRQAWMVTRSAPTSTPLDTTFTQSFAVQADASAMVKTSLSCSSMSQAGPE
jgi:hypothetical protein